MTFAQFLSILLARKWIVLAVALLAMTATFAASMMWPKKYTAVASVVADVRPDPISTFLPGMAAVGYVATQIDVILSDRVALKVVRNLKLAENLKVREEWAASTGGNGTVETWLAERLQSQLKVNPSKESSVILVGYSAPDPTFAAALANAFVNAYIETTLELRVDPARQYSNFFETRVKSTREELEAAQSKLSAFQREKGIIATDERLDVENIRLNELSSQLVVLQALSADSSSRQTQAAGASSDKIQEVLGNPVIASLKNDLSRNEVRLKELNSKFGDNHPSVMETKASIAELRARVDAETRRVTGGVAVTNTINRQREAQVRSELETQRLKLLRLKGVRDEGSVLVRGVENAQRVYDAVLTRFNQTSLESQTTQSNVNLLSQAVAPLAPSSPKPVLYSIAALFVGTFIGVLLAFIREMFDRRVRSLDDIPILLELSVIGVMPKASAKRTSRRQRIAIVQNTLLKQLPYPRGTS